VSIPPAQAARCPICGKPAAPAARPFCGKRCADIDLGRWFGETYRIDGGPLPEPGSHEDDLPG
jgi:endogenous inhibitor of DNA gyrase (YacG/DUF329 family)